MVFGCKLCWHTYLYLFVFNRIWFNAAVFFAGQLSVLSRQKQADFADFVVVHSRLSYRAVWLNAIGFAVDTVGDDCGQCEYFADFVLFCA